MRRLSSRAMSASDGFPGRTSRGRGATRASVAYLLTVALGAWTSLALEDARQRGDLGRAAREAAVAVVGSGLPFLILVTLLVFPAMVGTIELVHRLEAGSAAVRSVIGAAAWAAWCLFVAVTLALASRIVLVPETLATDLALFAASGAVFSLLAFGGHEARAGGAMILAALLVAALVIVGSFWMAGRWGSAA